jgi:hypothetical protein
MPQLLAECREHLYVCVCAQQCSPHRVIQMAIRQTAHTFLMHDKKVFDE